MSNPLVERLKREHPDNPAARDEALQRLARNLVDSDYFWLLKHFTDSNAENSLLQLLSPALDNSARAWLAGFVTALRAIPNTIENAARPPLTDTPEETEPFPTDNVVPFKKPNA